jgi:hypothetical protein
MAIIGHTIPTVIQVPAVIESLAVPKSALRIDEPSEAVLSIQEGVQVHVEHVHLMRAETRKLPLQSLYHELLGLGVVTDGTDVEILVIV